jgi:hypothetical protein
LEEEEDEDNVERKIKRDGEKKARSMKDNTLSVFAGLGFY